ncbi:hypothetical protein [Flavobacterium magnesitis]|uniref:hypothetical protein n=1 Tax=Flavobacterium magnesitis TaxID=3138077 RepID=UPI00358F7B02
MKSLKQNRNPFLSLKRLIYFVMSVIALSIYVMQKQNIALPPLINNYVNDLLCLPLVLGAITFMIRCLKKDNSFMLPMRIILCMAAFYSFYFEYYLPELNPRYTADWIDVLLYFTGALAFYFVENPNEISKLFKRKTHLL